VGGGALGSARRALLAPRLRRLDGLPQRRAGTLAPRNVARLLRPGAALQGERRHAACAATFCSAPGSAENGGAQVAGAAARRAAAARAVLGSRGRLPGA